MLPTKPRVLLVGWDAADWKVARPLMAAGEMPHLARLVATGASGNLATIRPALSPMLWTSIATGKRPHKHGIHGFSEPTPDGADVRPITTLGRTAKAVWNILHQAGHRPSVVGWWPSYPAEPIRGVMVSNFYTKVGEAPEPGPLPPRTVYPDAWADRLAELRVAPMELPAEALGAFAPLYRQVDQQTDKRLHALGKILAETVTVHAAATEVLEHADWDFAAVYYDAIDHFSHAFMRYHPPQQRRRVSDADFAVFGPVVANAYKYHDAMLGRLIALAGPGTTVLVISDHGFQSDALRPAHIPAEAAGPAVEHREFGLFVAAGPGIAVGETVFGATLLDVCPTVLHLYGLPIGQDMDGKVLATALADPAPVATVPSWEDVPGDAGQHPPESRLDPVAAAEAMRQLVDLGYVAPPAADGAETVAETVAELRYNLARSLDDAGQPARSIPLYRQLRAAHPGDQRFPEQLVNALLQTADRPAARAALDDFDRTAVDTAATAATELDRLRAERPDDALERFRPTREADNRHRLAERSTGFPVIRGLLRLRLDLADGRPEDARAALAVLEQQYAGRDRVPAVRLAESYLLLDDLDRAMHWVERALADDPDDWQALGLSARVHLRRRQTDRALEAAAASVSLVYDQPVMHYIMGRSLLVRGDYAAAEPALRMAIAQLPGLVPAHTALVHLYGRHLGRPADAFHHRNAAAGLRLRRGQQLGAHPAPDVAGTAAAAAAAVPVADRPGTAAADPSRDVVIVAGLPRSGTSMLMQLVHAGGLLALTDGRRLADSDNPRGYFEFEQATRISTDASWLPLARGKVVKLALPLVRWLPPGEAYWLIIIERDVRQVIASQRRMLDRLGRGGAVLSEPALAAEYARQREQVRQWVDSRTDVAVLSVRYDQVLADPRRVAAQVAEFVGRPFDVAAAAAAVDPSLQRQFAGTG